MRSFTLGLLATLLLAPEALQATVQVQNYMMTKTDPAGACSGGSVALPVGATNFSVTDKEAYLWFSVTGANAGDVFASEYYTPAGQYYSPASGAWNPLSTAGNYCFSDLALPIANNIPATLPGTWTVRVTYNGSVLFSLTFTISPATSSGLHLNINQAITTSCPNNKMIVSVTDSSGNPITGLNTSNFTLKENGTLRSITVTPVNGATSGALSLAILIDVSGSLSSSDLANEKAAAKQLISQMGASDMVAIYSFTDDVKLLRDYTSDKALLNAAVDAASGGGSTALYKAIQTASQTLGGRTGRKAIVLMTDGDDTVGGATIDQAIAAAKTAGVPVFPVGFGSANTSILTRLATETGGFYSASATSADLQRILGLIGQAISSQYEITYTSGAVTTDNTVEIAVTVGGQSATATRVVSKCSSTPGTTGLTVTVNQVITTSCPNNKLIVSVTNAQGAVTGLTAANFTLKESGVIRAVTVTPVTSGSSGPLSLAILIDVSGSLSSSDLANEKAAAKQLISQMSGSDMVAIYSFTDDVRLLRDYTSDKALLNAAVDGASGGGSTALYKAIQTASQALGLRTGRKAIVLMTDGDDTVGGATIDQAIAAAKTAGVPVFPVGFGSANTTVLTRIATETGGFYSPSATSADLQHILGQIGQIISSQYEVSYTSVATTQDNTVEITVSYGGQTSTTTRTVSACSSSSNCTYLVQPQSVTVPAGGANGTIIVITQAGCALNPSANVSWIKILGSNQGAVSYQVDPNPGSARSGTIAIGNRTVPVTQEGGVTCAYSITPTSNVMPSQGGTTSFRLAASGTTCPWNVVWSGSWMTVTSPTSGKGNALVIFKVDPNTSTSPRSGTVTVAGLTYTLGQSGGASATEPSISQGGVVNAASNRAGAVARGSFFTIYGTNIGPPGYMQVQNYPIPDNMGGVVVTFTRGSYNKRGYLHFVSSVQINGILPSDVPLGDVQVTVSYNGIVSSAATITVTDTTFGTFSAAGGPGPGIVQNYNSATDAPLNMASFPAKPNQIVVLWGTGLGPITTGDNTPPPGGDLPVPVEVRVGGKIAKRLYSGRAPTFAGVDNIYFEVPADAPLGCSVPVQVTAAGVVANTVRMAISADGKKCQDPGNPFGATTANGAKSGIIGLMRISLKGQIDSSKPAVDSTFDVGLGGFGDVMAGGDLAFSPFMNLPPAGSCVSTNKALDFGAVMGTNGTGLDRTVKNLLDVGPELTITGPNGSVKIEHFDPNSAAGPYLSLLGGNMPVDGTPTAPLFLNGGSYTISAAGGKDVGGFSTSLTLNTPLTWSNQAALGTITRGQDFTVTWTGGDASQTVLIAGGSSNQKTKQSGGFFCLAPALAGSFVVPASVLADLPVTSANIGMSETIGMLAVSGMPMSSPQKFTAPGLDQGMVFYTSIAVQAVAVR